MKKILFLILFLFLITVAYGTNEIRSFQESGNTLYSVIREVDGDVWYITGQVFEAWGTDARTANDYDIALTDKSGGFYVGDFNTAVTAGYYYIITHQQEGANPADTDPPIWQEYGYWNGTIWTASNFADVPTKEEIRAEIDSNSTQLTAIIEDSGTTIPGTLADLKTAMDSNFAAIDFATSGIDANFVALKTAMDANFAALNDPNVEEIRAEIDANSTQLALIVEDTNELQTDWTDGGRLDTILDAIYQGILDLLDRVF